jgi:hypothetical protein
MLIKKALICAKHPKTDGELKAIMATHPGRTYGFYKSRDDEKGRHQDSRLFYQDPHLYSGNRPDAIWFDEGLTWCDRDNKWIDKECHAPNLGCYGFNFAPNLLEEAWWKASVALILNQLPDDYHLYSVIYGELEDETPDNVEASWREDLLALFGHAPEVEAALRADERL